LPDHAAKQTAALIPLCIPAASSVDVELFTTRGYEIEVARRTTAQTASKWNAHAVAVAA